MSETQADIRRTQHHLLCREQIAQRMDDLKNATIGEAPRHCYL
jgi:hypothetical protein